MDHSSRLTFGALLASMSFLASAGYAQPSPPSGWGGSAGSWTYRAANAAEWLNGTVRTNAALNVGGRTVLIPAALRVAANAGTFASRWMFAHPLLLTVAGVAWLASQNIHWDGSRWLVGAEPTEVPGSCSSHPYKSGCYRFKAQDTQSLSFVSTYQEAAQQWVGRDFDAQHYIAAISGGPSQSYGGQISYTYVVRRKDNDALFSQYWGLTLYEEVTTFLCPTGSQNVDGRCMVGGQPLETTEEDFVTHVSPLIQPEDIPEWLPPSVPLPVENPVINPSDDPQPAPRPLRIPLGEPQPIPNTDPLQYRQPVIRVSPAPSPSSPWQLDLTPEDVVSTSPVGIREPSADPLPEGSTSAPTQTDDFCAKNPDVLACQKEIKLGELQPVPLTNEDRELEIEAQTGHTAACPAPVSLSVGGRSIDISYDMVCEFADLVRPLFIGFAWLSAALTFMGVSRRS